MQILEKLPKIFDLKKIILLSSVFTLPAISSSVFAENSTLAAIPKLELSQYLGLWYEIARKPVAVEAQCVKNATARYTINEYGNVAIDNRCIDSEGNEIRELGEGFLMNEPFNSKIKVSYLPEPLRWVPVNRGDYWVLKIDPSYQMVLVGGPKRQHLWLFSRDPHPDEAKVTEFLRYAQTVGFSLKDIIRTKQTD